MIVGTEVMKMMHFVDFVVKVITLEMKIAKMSEYLYHIHKYIFCLVILTAQSFLACRTHEDCFPEIPICVSNLKLPCQLGCNNSCTQGSYKKFD